MIFFTIPLSLLRFHLPQSSRAQYSKVILFCVQLNGIDIGDGYILTVSLADFKKTTNDKCSTSQNDSSEHITAHTDGDKSNETLLCLDQHELSYFENILDNLEISEKTVIEECDFKKLINR